MPLNPQNLGRDAPSLSNRHRQIVSGRMDLGKRYCRIERSTLPVSLPERSTQHAYPSAASIEALATWAHRRPIAAFFLGLRAYCWPLLAGCQANATKVAPAEAPVVPVGQPVQREVTDYVDFTGRTEAVYSVDIRPRVTGYLVEHAVRGRIGGKGGGPAVRD